MIFVVEYQSFGGAMNDQGPGAFDGVERIWGQGPPDECRAWWQDWHGQKFGPEMQKSRP